MADDKKDGKDSLLWLWLAAAAAAAVVAIPAGVAYGLWRVGRRRLGRVEYIVVGVACLIAVVIGWRTLATSYFTWLGGMIFGPQRLDALIHPPVLALGSYAGVLFAGIGLVEASRFGGLAASKLTGLWGPAESYDDRPTIVPTEAEREIVKIAAPAVSTADLAQHSATTPVPLEQRTVVLGRGTGGEPVGISVAELRTHAMLFGATGSGKALALDTPIPTPDGWTTMGELAVGHTVLDERGRPCRVTFATEIQYERRCYEVAFDDGSVIVADAAHLWETTAAGVRAVRTTTEVLATVSVGHTISAAGSVAGHADYVAPASGRFRIVSVAPVASVPVRCIQVDSPSHLYLAGEAMIPTHNTETIKTLAGGLMDIGIGGIIIDLKEDAGPGGLREWCENYAHAHHVPYQELCLSRTANEFWLNPLAGLRVDDARDLVLSLMRFDDEHWQNINKKLLGQLLKLIYWAHEIDPTTQPAPNMYEIGKVLSSSSLAQATKRQRALIQAHYPDMSTDDEFSALARPSDAERQSATGFGAKIIQMYDTEAGAAVLRPDAAGRRRPLDVGQRGLCYVGLDSQGKPDLAKMMSAALLQRLAVEAAMRATGQLTGEVAQRFVIVDEASVVNRDIVQALLSKARSAGISLVLATQGPLDFIDKGGDDFSRLSQNTNVMMVMAQGEPRSAEMCADYLGFDEVMNSTYRDVQGELVTGSVRRERTHRVSPDYLRSMKVGEMVLRVGKPAEWVRWLSVNRRTSE